MKKFLTLIILNIFLSNLVIGQAYIDNSLFERLRFTSNELISINVFLLEQVNIDSLHNYFRNENIPLKDRYRIVNSALVDIVDKTQYQVIDDINDLIKDNRYVYEDLQTFYIVNMISLSANPELILKLAERPDIAVIEENRITLKIEEPVSVKYSQLKIQNGTEAGLIAINAHLMWAIGYTGKNRVGMNVDTGVNFKHPSISSNYLGNYLPLSQCWFPFNNPTPLDISDHTHGTHTIGTMMGLDTLTHDTIGVAYNASWISTDPIVSDLNYLRTLPEVMTAFEWALNPDEDTNTVWDMPDVINNSWGWVDPPDTFQCTSPLTSILNVCEAVGIAVVFSAGNDGDLGAGSVGEPAHKAVSLVNAFAVGSVNGNISTFPISDFSSLGPTICADTGSLKIKPEVVAPGQDVRSAMGEDEYGYMSGTSMAGPHVAGAILLLKEAFPFLSGEELKYALYNSAVDLGAPGEDNTYGKGIIDVFAAYQYLSQTYSPELPVDNSWDVEISEINNPDFDFDCSSLIFPEIVIRNSGSNTISDINISYVLNSVISFDTIWTGQLLSGNSIVFSFPEIVVEEGFNSLVFNVTLDTLYTEFDRFNNYKTSEFRIGKEFDLPYFEDFESVNKLMTNSPWLIRNPDERWTWTIDTIGNWPGNTQGIFMDYYYYIPDAGQIDELISPIINLPDTGGLELYYSIAYRQRRSWTNDSLKIYVSVDCGDTFPFLVYANGGDSLETYPYNFGYLRFIPDQPDHWRHDTLDLSQFIGNESVLVKFTGINNRGNSLWLDNIGLNSIPEPIGINNIDINEYKIFPNPTTTVLVIECLSDSHKKGKFIIYDINGRLVRSGFQINKTTELNVSGLNPGIYFITINDGISVSYHKFVKN